MLLCNMFYLFVLPHHPDWFIFHTLSGTTVKCETGIKLIYYYSYYYAVCVIKNNT